MLPSPPPALLQIDLGEAARGAGIRAAFTTRVAGNLGLDVGDDPGAVQALRSGLREWAGSPVYFADHVHGTRVLDPGLVEASGSEPVGDAWCASAPVALGVLAADCLPVLFYDPSAQVVGAAHAGRVGLFAGVLTATVARMRERGARRIEAVIGPRICGACYEVSAELAETATAAGHEVGRSRWATPALNLPTLAIDELEQLDVSVRDLGWCTWEDPRFFSHRSGDRSEGRHAGLIVMTK